MPKFFTGKRDIYLEVADRYEKYIRLGVLVDGDKLPSVRTVAEDMGVNPNTVQRAYAHLEELGLVISLPKKGVFVNNGGNTAAASPSAVNAITELKNSGISKQELLKIISEVYDHDQH